MTTLTRTLAACGLLISVLPSTPAFAQIVPLPGERATLSDARVSAFIAYAPRFTRAESRRVVLDQGFRDGAFEVRYGEGRGAGGSFEVRAFDAVRLATSFAYIRREAPARFGQDDSTEAMAVDAVLSRVSVVLRLQESTPALQLRSLNAALHAGPAYVLEIPRAMHGRAERYRSMSSWGISAGFDGEAALGGGVALQVGIEDYVVRWNEEELARRVDEAFAVRGLNTATVLTAQATHAWLVRLALAFNFR